MTAVSESRLTRGGLRRGGADDGRSFKSRTASVLALWAGRLLIVLGLGLIWYYISANEIVDPILIGNPVGTLEAFWTGVVTERSFLPGLLNTLWATLLAFALGSAAGVLTGLIFAVAPFLERLVNPLFTGLNAMPRLALAPLFLLWFGLGLSAKVALGFSLTFFIVLSSTIAGINSVDRDMMTLTRTLGATGPQRFWRLTLPNAVPTLFSGLRLGLIYALLGVVGQEIIGSRAGLGQLLSLFANTFQINAAFAVLLVLALLGTFLTWIASVIEGRLLKWR